MAADADVTAGLASKAQADWRRGVAVRETIEVFPPRACVLLLVL